MPAEPDVLKFPVSLLTAIALMDGIIIVLAQRLKLERNRYATVYLTPGVDDEWIRRAARKAEEVIGDVQGVMQISDVSSPLGYV